MSVVDRGEPAPDWPVFDVAPHDVGPDAPRTPPWDDRWLRHGLDVLVVAACALFVFWQLHPNLILAETTPTGGDMGAHVWAFGYLRDTLLPSGQLAGWTPDWYAGFPAFQFYMVVPFLAMVVLNAGWTGMGAVAAAMVSVALSGRAAGVPDARLPILLGVTAGVSAGVGTFTDFAPGFQFGLMAILVLTATAATWLGGRSTDSAALRRGLAAAAIVIALFGIALPYGVAFKVVAVSGVVAMPVCAYAFGRLAGLAFPTPALLAVSTLAFEFDTNFTIYGGNIPSTMAGEFAFSISLALALLYLGLLIRGLRTGVGRGTAAAVLALVGLCHLLPAFFALAGTAIFLLVHVVDEERKGRRMQAAVGAAVLCAVVASGSAIALVLGVTIGPVVVVATVALLVVGLVWNLARHTMALDLRPMNDPVPADDPAASNGDDEPDLEGSPSLDHSRLLVLARGWWLVSMGAVAGLLAAWWVLPFFWKRTYLNDMGWEKTATHTPGTKIWDWFRDEIAPRLVPTSGSNIVDHAPTDLRLWAALAIVGALLSIAFRHRVGTGLLILGLTLAVAFVYTPQGRLWNARILPFWYLVIYLLAAIGIGEIFRSVAAVLAPERDRTVRPILWVAAPMVAMALMGFLAAQLHKVPWFISDESDQGVYQVGVGPVSVDVTGSNISSGWAKWNFRGYERKDMYPEYKAIVDTMSSVGETNGCGRALWEYSSELNAYGTPMALMLLPHWTDGCIGSMEGLYFEASSTTPFHFLVQSELSTSPSRAQRDMPYREFDIDAGVAHLQMLGVRYYMAYTPQATEAARAHADLTELDSSQHWTVFEVADAPLVEGLAHEPAVTTASESQHEWLCAGHDESGRCTGAALDWFQDATAWPVALAASGPDEWQRVDPGSVPERRPITPAVVSDVETDDDRISFSVDQVGAPVVVKASYFPNWSVSGADGPYRVAPNLMVVVPTDTDVTLSYGRTGIDWFSILLTVFGVAVLVACWRRGPLTLPPLRDDTVA